MSESVKPLVDRIVSQPLQFARAVQEEAYDQEQEGCSYIVIRSKTQKAPQEMEASDAQAQGQAGTEQGSGGSVAAQGPAKTPASFAEALKMYTTKKQGSAAKPGAERAAGAGSNGESSGKPMGLGSEVLLSDDEYHGSSTEEEDHPVSLLDDKATPNSNEDSRSVSSSSSTITSPASSSGEEDEEEVFHEASDVMQPSAAARLGEQLDGDESDDSSFRGVSHSEDSESEDRDKTDDLHVSEDEKQALKEEAAEYALDKVSPLLTAPNWHTDQPDDDDDEEDELKHKSSQPPSPSPPTQLQDKNSFYQFNESVHDRGSNKPHRIVKNWGPKLTQLKPRGLLNHGVTCYTNAAVQAMIHIPAMQHYFFQLLRGDHSDVVKPSSVSMLLAETTLKMWAPEASKNTYINPDKLINALEDINCMMSVWNQEDSHEYFMSLMSRLQEDSVPKGHKMTESIIYEAFGGLLQQTVKCNNCGEISTTEQPFYDLSLHLKGRKTTSGQGTSPDTSLEVEQSSRRRFSIEKSIHDFFNPELIKKVDNKEGYNCEKCKMITNAIKTNKIIRAPETLVVHLKKFRFNGTSSSKMKQAVSYPMFLDLTEYCHESISSLPVRYQLICVVVHEGRSLSSGHYIAHCKQPDGSWATYDDEYINKISEKQLLKEPNAYYLIYTRLTPKSIELVGSDSRLGDLGLPMLQRPPSSSSATTQPSKRKNKKKNKKRRLSP